MPSEGRLGDVSDLALLGGTLLLGVAIGVTFVGIQIQPDLGCGGMFQTGACATLAGAESWAMQLVAAAMVGYLVAFAIEYHTQEDDSSAEPAD